MIALGEVHVWRVWLDAEPDEAERLALLLSAAEAARAQRLRRDEDRRRFVIARARLRQVLGRYLDIAPAAVPLAHGRFGKPHLLQPGDADNPADATANANAAVTSFNVSHAGSLALIALTTGRAIGVDIEQARELVDADAIARRFFSPDEQAQLAKVPPPARRDAFYQLWTAKEAFAKGLGEGLRLPLSSFTVRWPSDAARSAAVLSLTWPENPAAARWTLAALDVEPGYWAALAVDGPMTAVRRLAWD